MHQVYGSGEVINSIMKTLSPLLQKYVDLNAENHQLKQKLEEKTRVLRKAKGGSRPNTSSNIQKDASTLVPEFEERTDKQDIQENEKIVGPPCYLTNEYGKIFGSPSTSKEVEAEFVPSFDFASTSTPVQQPWKKRYKSEYRFKKKFAKTNATNSSEFGPKKPEQKIQNGRKN